MISIIKLLKKYTVKYPSESSAFQLLDIVKNEDCFSKSNNKGNFTGSAWVVSPDKRYVLMTHHRKLQMWLQLGGHADGNENLFLVALREAKEESGIESFICLDEDIFDVDIHKIPSSKNDKAHLHYDIRFLFEADPESSKIVVSDESYDVAWISIENVLNMNSESSIERMVKKTLML